MNGLGLRDRRGEFGPEDRYYVVTSVDGVRRCHGQWSSARHAVRHVRDMRDHARAIGFEFGAAVVACSAATVRWATDFDGAFNWESVVYDRRGSVVVAIGELRYLGGVA